jgi:hypothetical protein
VLSPDASLVRLDRWQALTPEQHRGFAPLFPRSGCRTREAQRRRSSLSHGSAQQDGYLSSVRSPAWLVAHSSPAGRGGLARNWRSPPI